MKRLSSLGESEGEREIDKAKGLGVGGGFVVLDVGRLAFFTTLSIQRDAIRLLTTNS